jgi:hypothetical protein
MKEKLSSCKSVKTYSFACYFFPFQWFLLRVFCIHCRFISFCRVHIGNPWKYSLVCSMVCLVGVWDSATHLSVGSYISWVKDCNLLNHCFGSLGL